MCFPCWPCADVYVEEISSTKKKSNKGTLYYDPHSKTWVELKGMKRKMATTPNHAAAPPEPQHFQPQVPHNANGPQLHVYIPRDENSVFINGVIWVPQTLSTAPVPAVGVAQMVPPPPPPPLPPQIAVPLPTAYMQTSATHYHQGPIYGPSALFAPPQAPAVVHHHQQQQHHHYPYQPPMMAAYQAPPPMHIGPAPMNNMPINYPPFTQPAFGSVGYTGQELLHSQMANAQEQDMNRKQEMKPADDNPSRMYWVREREGDWTQRNRVTIDSGDIGECRWYALDGQFYAVRLSDG